MPGRTVIRWVARALLLLAIASVWSTASAQAPNPFRPQQPAAVEAQAEKSYVRRALDWAVSLQRTMLRDIARYMANIRDEASATALLFGIGFAFLYGVAHTLGPGHGKTIVASYFVGTDARIWRGLWMGVQIAISHVISAIVLVVAVDITFRQMLGGEPAQSWWIRLVSFGLIATIGLVMLIGAIRSVRALMQGRDEAFRHICDHGHDHDHGHRDDHGHRHDGKKQGALAILAGVIPCTGAILVMLFALANGIVVAGVLMVIAISAGMALTMAAIGIASILVRRVMLLAVGEGSPRGYILGTALEFAGALLILAVGLTFLAGTIGEKYL